MSINVDRDGFCEVTLCDGGVLNITRADFDPLYAKLNDANCSAYLATDLMGCEVGIPLGCVSYITNVTPDKVAERQAQQVRERFRSD